MPNDILSDDARQLPLHGRYYHAPEHVLQIVEKRKSALTPYFSTFTDGPFTSLLREQQGAAVQVFFYLAATLVANVATLHVDTACMQIGTTPNTLYIAIHRLRKGGLIKKWKTGKYLLNPYCVWAYSQVPLRRARIVWDQWEEYDVQGKEHAMESVLQGVQG